MANPTNFPDLQVPGGQIHDDKELCEHLLRSLDRPDLLEILPSKIDLGGTGLFAKEVIAEGAEVFRSTPLLSCIGHEMSEFMCDYCHTSLTNGIDAAGHLRMAGDALPTISRCTQCRVCSYCSKVSQLACYIRFGTIQ